MNILITGKDSYIGTHIKAHLEQSGHTAQELDTIGDTWQQAELSRYDAVVHVAAIVHEDAKTASQELFEKVNVELPVAIAEKAKAAGVKHFVFLSTMAVYGADKALTAEDSTVRTDAELKPVSLYGKSKLEAEHRLSELTEDSFCVSFVRPPNVYGPGCKGNYMPLFRKLSKLLYICPRAFTDVRQSMLYIDNLSELIRLIVEQRRGGVFLPQDDVIPSTVDLIVGIRRAHGKKTHCSGFLGLFVRLFGTLSPVKKLYGGVCYAEQDSDCFDYQYRIVPFETGLYRTYMTNEA